MEITSLAVQRLINEGAMLTLSGGINSRTLVPYLAFT